MTAPWMRYYGGSALYYCWALVWLSAFHSNISHFCNARREKANLPFGSSLAKSTMKLYTTLRHADIYCAHAIYWEESGRLASNIYVLPSGPGVLCRRIFHKRITSARWNGQRAQVCGNCVLCALINLRTRSIMAHAMNESRWCVASLSRQYYTLLLYAASWWLLISKPIL